MVFPSLVWPDEEAQSQICGSNMLKNICKLLTEFYHPAAKFCFVLISFSILIFTVLDFGFLYLGIIDIMGFIGLFCGDVPSTLCWRFSSIPDLLCPLVTAPPTPGCNKRNFLWVFPDVPWRAKSPFVENHWIICVYVIFRGSSNPGSNPCFLCLLHWQMSSLPTNTWESLIFGHKTMCKMLINK